MKSVRSKVILGRSFAALLLAGVLVVTSGCVALAAAGAAGAGAVWYSGKLEAHLSGGVDTVHRAAQAALSDLEFAKISDRKSAVDAELISRTALDKKVEITLRQVTGDTTKVSIRVGLMGDEALSTAVLEKIKSHL